MGTILRVTKLQDRFNRDAIERVSPEFDDSVWVVIDAITESVEVEGTADNLNIEWSGDLGLNPDISGNILKTRFALGAHTVTATGLAGGSSVTVRAWQAEMEVLNGPDFAITDEPQMPVITARLRITGPVTATIFDWRCRVEFGGTLDCPTPPGVEVIHNDLELTQAGGDQFTPSFDKVRGRQVDFGVTFAIDGQTEDSLFAGIISGTNPQRSEVEAALPHDTLRRIACRESG